MIRRKMWPKVVVFVIAIILVSGAKVDPEPGNKVTDMVLKKFQQEVVAGLDKKGYGRLAKVLGNMDITKWEKYRQQIKEGKTDAVFAELLKEQEEAMIQDLYDRAKDRLKKLAAQKEVLGGNTMQYLDFVEKHHKAMMAMATHAWNRQYPQAGNVLIDHIKKQARIKAEEFTFKMIQNGLNYIMGDVAGTNIGGIYVWLIKLEVVAIEEFRKYTKDYFSTIDVIFPDGTEGKRTLCEHYAFLRKQGWTKHDAFHRQGGRAPLSIYSWIAGKGRAWYSTHVRPDYSTKVTRPDDPALIRIFEICYTATQIPSSEIERKLKMGRSYADRELFGEIKTGMEEGKKEIKKIFRGKFKEELNLIVTVVDSKSGDKVMGATVTLDGEKKDAPTGVATFTREYAFFDPAGWMTGSGKSEIEVSAGAKGYESKSGTFGKDDLANQFDASSNSISIKISLDPKGPEEVEIVVTVLDSKSGSKVSDATVTFDGETQTASNGVATFKRKSDVLAPDNSGTQVKLSAEADKYEPKSKDFTWGELAQKLDKDNNQINIEISLDPKKEPKELNLVVTVVDAKTKSQISNAKVTVDGDQKDAPTGVATFVRDRSILDPANSQNKIQVSADAKDYDSESSSFTWGFLSNRYDKDKNEIQIQISLNPSEKAGKIVDFQVHCSPTEIFEDEASICVAKIYYESGKVKDVSVGSNWTPGLVEATKGTVHGDQVKQKHTLPHTVDIEAGYQAKLEEGGQLWTAKASVVVKPKVGPQPGIQIAKAASSPSISVGGTVTYTFTVSNTGNCELVNVQVKDDQCNPVGYTGGDVNNDYVLDVKEAWTYECAMTLNQTGNFVNTATVVGTDPDGKTVTHASAVTVNVTAKKVEVPDLYSLTRDAAVYDIKEAKLTVGNIQGEPSDLDPGLVTRQTPAAGTQVDAGTAVSFWLSKSEPHHLFVDPPRVTIDQDSAVTFTAILVHDDGTERDVTQQAAWTPGPGNVFIGREPGTFTVTAEIGGVKGFATVNVNEPEEPGWEPPISHADDTLANVPYPKPSDYTWYALCTKGVGEVVYGEDTDPTKYFIMGGPFPGPRTVKKWIDDNCPRWRCTLEGACAVKPAGGGDWNVFCNKETGAVTIGKGSAGSGQVILSGGFLGEPDARFWVDSNCPAWRCTKDGTCAQEPARGGKWKIFCDTESGAVTIGTGMLMPGSGKVIMDEGFLGEPDARMWLDLHCPRWRCTEDGGCATGPATGGDWYVFCAYDGVLLLRSDPPGPDRERTMAKNFLSESDARLWVNTNCPTWRCDSQNRCLIPGGPKDDAAADATIDDAIDDVSSSDQIGDCDGAIAEFSSAASDLDGMATSFENLALYFDQQLRSFDPLDPEARKAVCNNADVAYALTSARTAVDEYDISYFSLAALFGDVAAFCESGSDFDRAQAEYDRLGEQGSYLDTEYSRMVSDFGIYQCDELASRTDADDEADDSRDPDDLEAGVEVCGDGIDNDGDGEIDECDAGCCDKNVQVTVTDCGPAADDIFLIAVDGNTLGVTPKGAANTFNIELSPGPHSATITCLDDGSDPPGNDIGTACIWVVIFGGEPIGGDVLEIPYGGTATVGFIVPQQETAPPFPKVIDGSSLQHLEKKD